MKLTGVEVSGFHDDDDVCCCCLLPSTCFDGFQPKLGHRCNMGTLICWWGQRSHIKVKGHLRSSCKIGWKYMFMWSKVINQGQRCHQRSSWFVVPLYVHVVKGHIPRSNVIRGQVLRWAQNVKFTSFKKLVWLEPNLVYLYNVGIFTCSWSHKLRSKVMWGQFVR